MHIRTSHARLDAAVDVFDACVETAPLPRPRMAGGERHQPLLRVGEEGGSHSGQGWAGVLLPDGYPTCTGVAAAKNPTRR
jgi:hypothetical protein